MPNVPEYDDGITVVNAMPERAKLAEWKADPEAAMHRLFDGLPNAPDLRKAERVSPFMGMIEIPNTIRKVFKPGMALVGDAAHAVDPLWGVGCGWAFQSAEWLAEAIGNSLQSPDKLDRGLKAYGRRHRLELAGHEFMISDFSTGRGYNPIERLMFSAAARDPACADHVLAFAAASELPLFLAPRLWPALFG